MRSGTTALYSFLDQHPDVFMSPIKEPNYFAFGADENPGPIEGSLSVTDRGKYLDLFAGARNEKCVGEARLSWAARD